MAPLGAAWGNGLPGRGRRVLRRRAGVEPAPPLFAVIDHILALPTLSQRQQQRLWRRRQADDPAAATRLQEAALRHALHFAFSTTQSRTALVS